MTNVSSFLVAIALAAALALFYLTQSSHVAATGYEIDDLQATLAQARAQQQQLIWEIGRARSPSQIEDRARSELRLVPLGPDAVRFAQRSIDTAH
jgi:cell division protein FtsB